MKKGLTEEGFQVDIAMEGESGIDKLSQADFDLVLLDIMLPGISGLEVCSRIRKSSDVPIILLTALGTAENVALGLNTGADDYIVKPFKFIELVARIRSLLRRSERVESVNDTLITFSDLEMNDDTKVVKRGQDVISLTSTEYRLLRKFMMNPNRVLSRVEIIEEVWGAEFDMGTNVVDVYVNYLRKKLEKIGPKLIFTVIGMGYVLKEE